MPKLDPFGEEAEAEKKQTERQKRTIFGQMAKALANRKGQ